MILVSPEKTAPARLSRGIPSWATNTALCLLTRGASPFDQQPLHSHELRRREARMERRAAPRALRGREQPLSGPRVDLPAHAEVRIIQKDHPARRNHPQRCLYTAISRVAVNQDTAKKRPWEHGEVGIGVNRLWRPTALLQMTLVICQSASSALTVAYQTPS